MQRLLLFFCLYLAAPSENEASDLAGKGSVGLDDVNFEKIISKFDFAVVKFDVAFPYGDKHDAYMALAREAAPLDQLLVAEVGVKDYADKDNEALANKYGAYKDNFPVVKLFRKGQKDPVTFDSKEFTVNELRKFIRANTGVYISLPGCLKELDHLVLKFMQSSDSGKKSILEDVDIAVRSLPELKFSTGKVYQILMEKIIQKGEGFVKDEMHRVKRLLGEKVSKEIKQQLTNRLNILDTFLLKDTRKKSEL